MQRHREHMRSLYRAKSLLLHACSGLQIELTPPSPTAGNRDGFAQSPQYRNVQQAATNSANFLQVPSPRSRPKKSSALKPSAFTVKRKPVPSASATKTESGPSKASGKPGTLYGTPPHSLGSKPGFLTSEGSPKAPLSQGGSPPYSASPLPDRSSVHTVKSPELEDIQYHTETHKTVSPANHTPTDTDPLLQFRCASAHSTSVPQLPYMSYKSTLTIDFTKILHLGSATF